LFFVSSVGYSACRDTNQTVHWGQLLGASGNKTLGSGQPALLQGVPWAALPSCSPEVTVETRNGGH